MYSFAKVIQDGVYHKMKKLFFLRENDILSNVHMLSDSIQVSQSQTGHELYRHKEKILAGGKWLNIFDVPINFIVLQPPSQYSTPQVAMVSVQVAAINVHSVLVMCATLCVDSSAVL